MKKLLIGLFILLVLSFVHATNFNSCSTFVASDTYTLTADLVYNGTCIDVQTGLAPAAPTIIDCQGHSLVGNESGNAIRILNSDNVTIQNCNVSHNYDNIAVVGSANGIIQNNDIFHDNDAGINFWYSQLSSNWVVQNNTIHGGTYDYGIACDNLTSSLIDGNYIYDYPGNHGTGRAISGGYFCSNNVFQNNRFNNASAGVRLNGGAFQEDNNSFINNTMTNMTNYGIVTFSGTMNTTVINNTFNDIALIAFIQQPLTTPECNNVVTGNTVNGLPIFYYNDSGLAVDSLNAGQVISCNADNSNFTNINISGNPAILDELFSIYQSDGIYVENLSMKDTHYGLNIATTTNSTFKNVQFNKTVTFGVGTANTDVNLTFDNISFYQQQGSNVIHAPAASINTINSTFNNFVIRDCNLSDPTFISTGFRLASTSTGNTVTNLSVYNCGYGIEIISGTNNVITHAYIENATMASVLVNSSVSGTKTFTLNNITVAKENNRNPSTFSIDDSVAASEQYSINPAQTIPTPPGGSVTFNGAILNLTALNGTMNFTNFNMSWPEYLTALYDENSVSLYQHNGANWLLLNNTPDTTNNVISYTSPALTAGTSNLFGLLANATNCAVLNTSGSTYYQPANYSGSPNFLDSQFSCVYVGSSNIVLDCEGFTIASGGGGGLGVQFAVGLSNVTIRNCNIDSYFYGIFSQVGNNNQFRNNNLTNSIATGIYLDSSTYNVVDSNGFSLNGQGIDLVYADTNNNLTNNVFTGSGTRGIDVSTTSNFNQISQNNFSSNNIDLTFLSSTANNITNNVLSGAGFVAVQIVGATSNLFQSNTISGAFNCVDVSSSATGNTFTGNVLSSCGNSIKIDSTANTVLSQNNISGSTIAGFTNTNSNTALSGDIFYNNAIDLWISATSSGQINATNILLLPASGALENYSNLSINDAQSGSESYYVNYGSDIPVDNSTYQKFQNKRFTLINQSVNASIDSLTYHYLDSELNASESDLQMFSYDGSNFANQIATLDTSANTLTKTNLNSFTQIGLYYAPFSVIGCKLINASGEYTQQTNLIGAGTVGINSLNACVVINASDVSYDCGNNQLNENLTPTTRSGFLVQGQDLSTYNNNITLKNCVIDGYYHGIETVNVNGLRVTNNTIRNITFDGITTLQLGLETTNSSIDHNTIHNTSVQAIQTFNLTYSNITDNVLYNNYGDGTHNGRAIELGWGTQNNLIQNNTGYNGLTGIRITGQLTPAVFPTPNNVFINNTMYDNVYGFFTLVGTHNLTLTGNNFSNNLDADWYFTIGTEGECDNTIENNTGTGGKPLLYYQNGNVASNLDAASIMLCNADGSNLTNVNVSGSPTLLNNYIQSDFSDNLHLINITARNINQGLRDKSGNNSVYTNFLVSGTPGKDANVKPASGPTPINDTYIGAIYITGQNNTFNNLSILDQRSSSSRIVSAFVATGNTTTINNLTIADGNYSFNNLGGVEINNTNENTINGALIYNYDRALFLRGGTNTLVTNLFTYSVVNAIYLNATSTGNYTLTNLTLSSNAAGTVHEQLNVLDTLANAEAYSLVHSSAPPTLPTGNSSVRNKYFNLTDLSGTANITQIDFLWTETEPVNESNLIVQRYNGSWNAPAQTLNTTTNTIVLTDQTGSWVFGLFDITGAGFLDLGLVMTSILAAGIGGVTTYLQYRTRGKR